MVGFDLKIKYLMKLPIKTSACKIVHSISNINRYYTHAKIKVIHLLIYLFKSLIRDLWVITGHVTFKLIKIEGITDKVLDAIDDVDGIL